MAGYSDPIFIKLVWVVCASLLAVRLIFASDKWRLGSEVPMGVGLKIYGVFVGVISSLMSIGGGVFVSSMMTLYGRSIHQGVGTASGVGPLIAIPGALGFMWAGYGVAGMPPGSLGYVSLIGAAIVVPTSILAAPWGAKMSQNISKRKLELTFATFLSLISLRFFLSLYL